MDNYKINNCCENTIKEILNDPSKPDALFNQNTNSIYINSKKFIKNYNTFSHHLDCVDLNKTDNKHLMDYRKCLVMASNQNLDKSIKIVRI